ncbi:hypothetical protein BOTCAL_0349g00120 [Botryotinia calthae]|uniref:DUF7587 domain-containing protein n=1 Tax=Botryotinia calthae TaxID=38488 RepID=A0A4Y8CV70_9HELO|nr:hypothetical protein BOTCAL_0349g00120 [Botryotinia calthae]
MALNINAVASLVEGLRIADETSEFDNQLNQSIKIISSQTQQTRSLAGSITHLSSLDSTQITSLCRLANEVTEAARILDDTVNTLKNAREIPIITYLTSLGSQGGADIGDGSLVQRMLTHSDEKIRSIVRSVLDNSSDDILWKIAEECYNQANSYSGSLHTSNYCSPRDEALECPYDPDYETEQYYEHEDRLLMDKDSAKYMDKKIEQGQEARVREERRWIEFWVLVLSRCPDGPTLFYPPANHEVKLHVLRNEDTPRYLFRTFDTDSWAKSNNSVVASIASEYNRYDSRIDLLSLSALKATNLMYKHLCGKYPYIWNPEDNLVSWTSSLLFAIQYAIWKNHFLGRPAAEIQICAVDTRRFPRGQFAPDTWLLQAYRNTAAEVGGDTKEFFRFRLEDERYQNGEFLSQGSVHHENRSCVVSLKNLQESGLYNLYPEFVEKEGKHKWTNRVLQLRGRWSKEQLTNAQEVNFAEIVAKSCFHAFETADIMLILLTFKARKMKEDPRDDNRYCPEWARKPDEVRRYVSAARLLESRKHSMNGRGGGSLHISNDVSGIQIVKELFDYT